MAEPAPATAVRQALKDQYHASLAMLGAAIQACPDDLWTDATPTNAFWQIAYHTLFFAHLYGDPDETAFRPWTGHHAQAQYPDAIPGPPDPQSDLPLLPPPYAKKDVLAYWRFCKARVDKAVDAIDVFAQTSGFPWYPIPKLDHQLVNIRHIQHGAAQLADRLRVNADIGTDWVGKRPVAD